MESKNENNLHCFSIVLKIWDKATIKSNVNHGLKSIKNYFLRIFKIRGLA